MTAWLNLRPRQAQFTSFNAIDLTGQVDRRKYILADQLVIGGRVLMPEAKTSLKHREQRQPGGGEPRKIAHFIPPQLVCGARCGAHPTPPLRRIVTQPQGAVDSFDFRSGAPSGNKARRACG